MWNTAAVRTTGELVCYIFHHWSGRVVDRSEIIVSDAGCTPIPREEVDDLGLPAWYLFRSIPQRLCPHAGDCGKCSYALGEVTHLHQNAPLLGAMDMDHADHGGFALLP